MGETAKGRTARYYATGTTVKGGKKKPSVSKRAKAVKAKMDKKINSTRKRMDKNNDSAKKRRKAIKSGKKIKGKDYDHKTKRFMKSSSNRGQKEASRVKGSKRKKR